jgi:hypothetical protein
MGIVLDVLRARTVLIFVPCQPSKWFLSTPERVTQEPWKGIEWEERGGFIEVNNDLDICPEEDGYDGTVRLAA